MSEAARVLENPVLKDRITLLKTAAETHGDLLLFQVELAPGGSVLRHYHTSFTEQFEVSAGELHVELNGKQLALQPGQRAVVPRGAVHRFYNPTHRHATFITEVRPARQFEKNLRISYGLARDGRTTAMGIAQNPLYLAVVFQYAETYLPGIPAWIQKAPFVPLAIVARLLGVDKALDSHYLAS